LTVAELADRFMSENVEQKREPGTVAFYRHLLDKIIRPALGTAKADKPSGTTPTRPGLAQGPPVIALSVR
jgi:hypothetical protein